MSENSQETLLAPLLSFGGDVSEQVTGGDMENGFTDGVADDFSISQDAGHGVTGSVEKADVYGGSSAQKIQWAATADGQFGFAQQLSGLDTNNNYGLSAYLKVLSATPSAYELFDYVLRVGPSSGGEDWQGSATAVDGASAAYTLTEVSWSNTAASPWIWVAAIANGTGDKVLSGDFENGFDADGVGNGMTTASSPADILAPAWSVCEGDPYAGSSAQGVYFSTVDGTSAAIGQQLTDLLVDYDYTASAAIKIPSLTAFNERDFVFRVGPTLGGDDFQASTSALDTCTATYNIVELNWQNTASTVWIWVQSYLTASLSSLITNGDFESGDWATGLNDAWTGAAGITGQVEEGITVGGTSAQGMLWSTTAAGADALTALVTQKISGLSAGHNYLFSGSVNLPDITAAAQNRVIFRLGPNSGGTDYTDSMTATTTSDPSNNYNPWNTITLTAFAEDSVIENDELATSGSMEIGFTDGVADGWVTTPKRSITGSIDTSDPQAGVSAQFLEFSTTAGAGQFAIQLTGLESNKNYGISGYVKITESLEVDTHTVVLRVGDASGSDSYQDSATATSAATADYELLEISLASTATTAWIWIDSLSAAAVSALVDSIQIYKSTPDVWVWAFADHQLDTSERVTSGDFEGAFVAGFNGAWGGSNQITGSANETDTFGGSNSAQSLVWTGRGWNSATSNNNAAVFYQNVTGGISANTTYGVTAHWKIANITAARYYNYFFRAGPRVSGGAVDYFPSASVSATNAMSAGYSAVTFSLESTASNAWIWFGAGYIGPDRSNYVASGDLTGGYTAGVADGWNISPDGIGAFVETSDTYNSAISAQALTWTLTATPTASFAQKLTSLSTDLNYTATAYIKYRTVSGAQQHLTMFRVGDASGSESFYASATAGPAASADYEAVTLKWASTANTAWLYIVDAVQPLIAASTNLLSDGDMEGGFTNGVADSWIISTDLAGNGLTGAVEETDVQGGSSAQGLAFSATSYLSGGVEAFAQQITGLSADTQYQIIAYVKVANSVEENTHTVVTRVGPNSATNSFYTSATASSGATADFEAQTLSWSHTGGDVWLWVSSLSAASISAIIDTASMTVQTASNTAHIGNIGVELEVPDGGIILDDIEMSPSAAGATAVMDSLTFTLSADSGTAQIDSICASLTSSTTGGILADDFSVYSASASLMGADSSNTATNNAMLNAQDWTITIPGSLGIDVTSSAFVVQVNNSTGLDPTKQDHYIAPMMYAFKGTPGQTQQNSATSTTFEQNWVDVGDFTSSAYVGNGNFRWIRVKNVDGFTGNASAFKAYLWRYHNAPSV